MLDECIHLGKTDITVAPLGIGTWAWGQRFLWEYGRDYGEVDVRGAFRAALDAGVNFFDTAEVYGMGNSERLLGSFLHEVPAERRPVVATKFNPLLPFRLRKPALERALRDSLGRLNLKRVDLYQIHVPASLAPMRTWIAALGDAVEDGLAKAAGVSNFDAHQMVLAHSALEKRDIPLASNQVHYSLLHREPETSGLLQICRDLGVTVIAYMPLGHGLLTGKYTPAHPPTGLRGQLYRRRTLEAVAPLIELLRQYGEAHGGKTPAQAALNWTLCKGVLPIVGVKSAAQVAENLGALGWRLTADEVAALDACSQGLQHLIKVWW
jgi:aryl-alcohol dehydrogenase-like predicted oxidoreductase